MQFTYHKDSGIKSLIIENESYKYLIKARRHKVNDEIYFRNLQDDYIYLYKLVEISRKEANFELISKDRKVVNNSKKLHLAWCITDPKTVEKNIASLNEIGVDKITFIYCEYSQKNFKINLEKLKKILINSSSQCGRSSIIKLEFCDCIELFLKQNPDSYILDFSKNDIENTKEDIKTLIIGCEGGFSKAEREIFKKDKIIGFNSSLILKSETAIISSSAKILI